MHNLLNIFLLSIMILAANNASAQESSNFYTLNSQNGLSSNCVLQMTQISDGRIIVATNKSIDVYDGQHFLSSPVDTSLWMPLPAYGGATHLFTDNSHHLWMKQRGRLYCLDLPTMKWQKQQPWNADDFFITDNEEIWLLNDKQLKNGTSDLLLQLPNEAGALQDVVSFNDSIYTFFSSGQLAVFKPNGQLAYKSAAYPTDIQHKYEYTSLVVKGYDNHFYQVRTGSGGSILLSFNTITHKWQQLLTSPSLMHTLTPTPTGILYITTPEGYISINTISGERNTFKELHLPDGNTLTTGVNTVWIDREGAIWLGTYGNGLLYTSPLSGLFDTRPINITVEPILTSIFLHGQPLEPGQYYDGKQLLSVTAPYVDHLTFSHDQNSLAFQFSTMNYVRPRSTCYRYRFTGYDNQWHTLTADSASRLVDDNGVLYLPLVDLEPGEYALEVMATTNPSHWGSSKLRCITFTILPPWWTTPMAYVFYFILFIAIIIIAFSIYRYRVRRKNREDMLLLQIQNLVQQVNQYQNVSATVVLSEPSATEESAEEPEPTPQEKEFMARATQLVEEHIKDPSYNVEQLAADLCMERTGLYKKLTAMIQQSPVAFIRSIRLHRAATMLKSGNKTISEIAELTGFSSTSYFSKCFQKEFGCKPSEYEAHK